MQIGQVYSYTINELPVQTGDLICTSDAGGALQAGQFWRLIGKLIPGEIEHIAIYVGPGDRCVEVGARGHVVAYELGGHTWNAHGMIDQRGLVVDSFYGIAYPLEGRGLPEQKIEEIRKSVAEYCLHQAETRKPYNLNFLDSKTEEAFYCSQLAYKAYLRHDIDLNTGLEIPAVPGTGSVIFPQEIWNCCAHRKP
jgi:hypothetical protein